MKIAIIGGAGSVGAPTAFYLAAQKLTDEILMIGGKQQNVLKQHAMDLSTAMSAKNVIIRAGDYEDLLGTDIVINAAGIAQGLIIDRMEMLPKNIVLIKAIAAHIKRQCPDAFVITATNPVDPLNYATYLAGGFDRKKLIGYSLNDSFRFREMIAKAYNTKVSRVGGVVIGEHGSAQVPLFSTVRIDGEIVNVAEDIKRSVYQTIPTILRDYEGLRAGRTAGWTCAIGLELIVRAVVENSGIVLPCSVVLDGEYGLKGLSISVPVALGRTGVQQIVEYNLEKDEKERFEIASRLLFDAVKKVESYL